MKKRKLTNKQKSLMKEWCYKNGACYFDYDNFDILLPDGGLFSIDEKDVKLPKIISYKKIKDGGSQILFSKKKYKRKVFEARLWMRELDETINYLKRMKKLLNNQGIKTNRNKV